MKHSIFTLALLAGIIISLPSCSTSRSASSSTSTSVSTSKSKKTTPKKSTAVYDDVEPASSQKSTSTADSDHNDIGGEWTVYSIKGKRINGETRPFINFNIDDHRLYGNNGCNIINADFTVSGGNRIAITNMLSTMMSCPDAQYEQAINQTLETATFFKVTKQGHEYYLELSNNQNKPTMTLRKHNMDFLNGSWSVIEIEGDPIDNPDVQMVIDIPELSIHGHTGCNILNGELLIDPDKSRSIQFANIATTRMMCPGETAKIETAFLVALEKAEFAHKGKNSTIIFSDKHDEPIIVLKKITIDNH